jgi:hypothetical protein
VIDSQSGSFLLAAGGVVVIWLLLGLLRADLNVLHWAVGPDGRVSTSRLQLVLWIVVVVYAFLVWAAFGIWHRRLDLVPNIPANVLIALGFTGTTTITAAGITSAKIDTGTLVKMPTSVSPTATGLSGILQTDLGTPDLGKIQMMMWTFIALGIYLYKLVIGISGATGGSQPLLPDIDPALMVLTGLTQGTYLGQKLVATSKPRLFSMDPRRAAPNSVVTVRGAALGSERNGNLLLLNGVPTDSVVDWNDTLVSFKVPDTNPRTGAAWSDPDGADVSVIAAGQDSADSLRLVVTRNPASGSAGQVAH